MTGFYANSSAESHTRSTAFVPHRHLFFARAHPTQILTQCPLAAQCSAAALETSRYPRCLGQAGAPSPAAQKTRHLRSRARAAPTAPAALLRARAAVCTAAQPLPVPEMQAQTPPRALPMEPEPLPPAAQLQLQQMPLVRPRCWPCWHATQRRAAARRLRARAGQVRAARPAQRQEEPAHSLHAGSGAISAKRPATRLQQRHCHQAAFTKTGTHSSSSKHKRAWLPRTQRAHEKPQMLSAIPCSPLYRM